MLSLSSYKCSLWSGCREDNAHHQALKHSSRLLSTMRNHSAKPTSELCKRGRRQQIAQEQQVTDRTPLTGPQWWDPPQTGPVTGAQPKRSPCSPTFTPMIEALQNLTPGSREDTSLCEHNQCHQEPRCTHIRAQSLVLSADSFNCELKLLLPAAGWVTAAARSHCRAVELQEEQVLPQTAWSWLQEPLLLLQQTAFLTRAQTYWTPSPLPSWCQPRPPPPPPPQPVVSSKGCGKAELVVPSIATGQVTANTAARKEGERACGCWCRSSFKMLWEVRQESKD